MKLSCRTLSDDEHSSNMHLDHGVAHEPGALPFFLNVMFSKGGVSRSSTIVRITPQNALAAPSRLPYLYHMYTTHGPAKALGSSASEEPRQSQNVGSEDIAQRCQLTCQDGGNVRCRGRRAECCTLKPSVVWCKSKSIKANLPSVKGVEALSSDSLNIE